MICLLQYGETVQWQCYNQEGETNFRKCVIYGNNKFNPSSVVVGNVVKVTKSCRSFGLIVVNSHQEKECTADRGEQDHICNILVSLHVGSSVYNACSVIHFKSLSVF